MPCFPMPECPGFFRIKTSDSHEPCLINGITVGNQRGTLHEQNSYPFDPGTRYNLGGNSQISKSYGAASISLREDFLPIPAGWQFLVLPLQPHPFSKPNRSKLMHNAPGALVCSSNLGQAIPRWSRK